MRTGCEEGRRAKLCRNHGTFKQYGSLGIHAGKTMRSTEEICLEGLELQRFPDRYPPAWKVGTKDALESETSKRPDTSERSDRQGWNKRMDDEGHLC